jgi:hypothetical protein
MFANLKRTRGWHLRGKFANSANQRACAYQLDDSDPDRFSSDASLGLHCAPPEIKDEPVNLECTKVSFFRWLINRPRVNRIAFVW